MKPQKKLFFHIGWGKCGTTTLQHFLHSNRKFLLKQSIYYPSIKNYKNHLCIIGHMWPPEDRKLYYKQLLKKLEKSRASTFILSAEGTHNAHPEIFEELFQRYDTYIICYMRSCIGFINSAFCQKIKRGCFHIDLFDLMINQNRIINVINDKIENWINKLGMEKFIFKSYNEITEKGLDLIEDFCSTLNVKTDQRFFYPGKQKISPSKAYQAFMLPINFTPIKDDEYTIVSYDLMGIDKKTNTGFDCNFIPSHFFKNPSTELINAIKRQGELLNDPHWLDRFYSEAKALSDDGWHDLPAHLQHAFFNNMTKESKHILRKYLSIEINNIEKPFLQSIEELSHEQFESKIELRRNFITKRIEDEQSLKTRRPILFRILWLKRKVIGLCRQGLENFYLFASKTFLYRAYTNLNRLGKN